MFYRSTTDQQWSPLDLKNLYAGPQGSACWLLGGGPSLTTLPLEKIRSSLAPIMAINLAGHGHIIPDFWTAYDPTTRFLPANYRTPRTLKFIHKRRAMDLLPGDTFKLCECPGVVFFEHEKRNFSQSFSPVAARILDWNDSFIQALDLLLHLGFRTIYLAGCDLYIAPSTELQQQAQQQGLNYQPGQSLRLFLEACRSQNIAPGLTETAITGPQYHFDEAKPLAATLRTDDHYQRTVQLLRLSRQALTQTGLKLISVTPHSRLNDFFPCQTIAHAFEDLAHIQGPPAHQKTRGLYTGQPIMAPQLTCPMRDLKAPLA